jgi:O-phospho-L-seryl-tRNASec:L-selenocysteinyl-tRNA synthase
VLVCFVFRVVEISKLCARYSIAHVINNAYGLQSASTCSLINSAVRKHGRVDAVISSMDKNFMVPVGGAMVLGFQTKEKQPPKGVTRKPVQMKPQTPKQNGEMVAGASTSITPPSSTSFTSTPASAAPLPNVLNLVSALYPGRASSSSITDLFITLLSMGVDGWQRLLVTRESLLPKFKARMALLAEQHGERLLNTDDNSISFGMTLNRLVIDHDGSPSDGTPPSAHSSAPSASSESKSPDDGSSDSDAGSTVTASSNSAVVAPSAGVQSKFVPSYLGSLLFSRNVSGPRVLAPNTPSVKINGITFQRYGTHSNSYPHAYVTAACGIGMEEREVEVFAQRLEKCIKEFHKQKIKQALRPNLADQPQA